MSYHIRGSEEITGTENVLDSRDILQRTEYLQDERDTITNELESTKESLDESLRENEEENIIEELREKVAEFNGQLNDWDEENGEELKALKDIEDDCSIHGETFIAEHYFEEYARELHEDINGRGATGWPYTCIDWEKAASELKQDYTSVEVRGNTYYYRA